MFAFSIADDFLFRDKTHYYVPVKGDDAPVDKYSYLGMSITAGNFLPSSKSCGNELTYASGAPRAGLYLIQTIEIFSLKKTNH